MERSGDPGVGGSARCAGVTLGEPLGSAEPPGSPSVKRGQWQQFLPHRHRVSTQYTVAVITVISDDNCLRLHVRDGKQVASGVRTVTEGHPLLGMRCGCDSEVGLGWGAQCPGLLPAHAQRGLWRPDFGNTGNRGSESS